MEREVHMITVLKGDITRLDFDVIVNAANEKLAPGGGVCGAIHQAAGRALAAECWKLKGCRTGQAKMTHAYNLPCKAVIHAVGPIYSGDAKDKSYLEAAYWNSMVLAYEFMKKNHMHHLSLAFPCISTGIYGYPKDEACTIAVRTVQRMFAQYKVTRDIDVTFVCFDEENYMLYKKALGVR